MPRCSLAITAVAFLVCRSSGASVLWRGDFETGDLSQWSRAQMVSPDRLQVVSSPVAQGRHALKVTVRQGDDPIGASGNRNELAYTAPEVEGSERFYRWSVLWPQSYPSAAAWQLFTQWHHSGSNGSPPIEFYVYGEEMRLRVGGSGAPLAWTAPLVRGSWRDFVFHVKWSSNPAVGFVELYLDGQLVLPKRQGTTLYAGQTNYLKQGLYRNATIAQEGVLYLDGMISATTLADVSSSTPPPPPPPVKKPSVVVADASIKVLPKDTPAGAAKAVLSAARNEVESFQVVILGGSTGARDVVASASALVGPCGSIPPSELRLYREEYLSLATPSNLEGGTGRWPDPLIPDVDELVGERRSAFPFSVPAEENRVVLAEVRVPPDAAPGIYTGSLALSGAGLQAVTIPIELRVHDFALPSTSSLPTAFGLGLWDACLAHFGSAAACGSDGAVYLRHQYARLMLAHRISTNVAQWPEPDGAGGLDWAGFDQRYGQLLDGSSADPLLRGARLTTAQYSWAPTADHYRAWSSHLRSRGWFERTFDFTCDRPPLGCGWADLVARASLVHAADAELPTLVTTSIQDAEANGVLGTVNVLAPLVNQMHDKPGYGSPHEGSQRAKYDAFLQSNPRNQLWWEQSCMSHGCGVTGGAYYSGWPSYMVDASAVQNRAMGWLAFVYGVGGELYWQTTHKLDGAWSSVLAQGGNGDGTLLYPGTPAAIGGKSHVPVASLRLKMIREGLEDYEYLKRVSESGDPAFARAVAQGLFPTAYQTRQPAEKLAEARRMLVARLLALEGKAPSASGGDLCASGERASPVSPPVQVEPAEETDVQPPSDEPAPFLEAGEGEVRGRHGCGSTDGSLVPALALLVGLAMWGRRLQPFRASKLPQIPIERSQGKMPCLPRHLEQ